MYISNEGELAVNNFRLSSKSRDLDPTGGQYCCPALRQRLLKTMLLIFFRSNTTKPDFTKNRQLWFKPNALKKKNYTKLRTAAIYNTLGGGRSREG